MSENISKEKIKKIAASYGFFVDPKKTNETDKAYKMDLHLDDSVVSVEMDDEKGIKEFYRMLAPLKLLNGMMQGSSVEAKFHVDFNKMIIAQCAKRGCKRPMQSQYIGNILIMISQQVNGAINQIVEFSNEIKLKGK